jgi:uncharacterized protein (DUF305 family)
MRLFNRFAILAFCSAIALPAAAQTSTPAMAPMATPSSPADQAMSTGMTKMSQTMSAAPMTGNADQDFVAMMLPHHQGAVDMARVELQYGHDPKLRHLARDIIAAQDKEIAEMHAWQKSHPAG